jgi:hypothetical protein
LGNIEESELHSQAEIKEAQLLCEAVKRAYEAQEEYYRIKEFTTQNYTPENGSRLVEPDAMFEMEGLSVDYWLAVLKAAEKTNSTHTLAPWSRETLENIFPSPIYNVYGVETADAFGNPSAVANSQLHYGTDQKIFIESQPLWRGNMLSELVKQIIPLSLYQDIKLLNQHYDKNDFGDSHSLVLLIDSLAVQNALYQLDNSLTPETLNGILKAGSYLRAKNSEDNEGQGYCEGDVLENVLNSLYKIVLGTDAKLEGNKVGNTWWGEDYRTSFYNNLSALQDPDTSVYKDLIGQVKIELSSTDLAEGGTGVDVIVGGGQDDMLIGGAGNDTYHVGRSDDQVLRHLPWCQVATLVEG